ncbi:Signal transduction histidine kinase [Nocardioides exalbidus]|uniref:Sensor-like histidine kinase SenX3 n=1 Tax=Nocardioides exalbidus TaxID=402596 RepID=A0A1H4M210_9ACTN|nr:HAMP domain-containing sensor histidine kinase [Nocardioides exalbidus]SEB76535.1 Signal transduction histidine kinase [Nocardioides exalbidus]
MQGQDEARDREVTPWADDQTREHLQVLVEGVAELAGFEQSAILLRRDGSFQVVVAASVADGFVGSVTPTGAIEREIERSDDWGAWRFVPHDRVGDEVLDYSHIPDLTPLDGDDAWHPLDSLFAPLYDDQGELRGLLGVDSPRDGRVPGPDKLDVLTRYAGVARTLVLLALEREQLNEKVRMATEAREIVRQALGEGTLDRVLAACRSTLVDCFDAVGLWLTAFDEDGGATTTSYVRGSDVEPPYSEIDDVVMDLAHRYWAEQYVAPFSRSVPAHPGLPVETRDQLLGFLDRIGIGSVLFVPLGRGTECLGFLVLTRVSDTRQWTEVERDAALDIGRDLGTAIANARQLERERAVVDRLRKLDSYRVEVVNTLGHELRNPLFSMSANLELLDVSILDEDGRHSVEAATRGASRMRAVIDDMLTMAQMSDPQREFEPVPVDMRRVVADVLDECRAGAEAASVTCTAELPSGSVLVRGQPDELHRALTNLTTNAIKYSDAGGHVIVRVASQGGSVVTTVEDIGIGISDADQQELFREFFRSTNPAALVRPGTGLGLAIVARIVDRHSGTIELSSERGEGTTATITLPAYVGTVVNTINLE